MCRPALRAPFGPCTAWELQHACSTGDVRLHGLPRVLAVDDDASLLLMPCMPMCGFCRRLPACMPKGGVIPLHAIVPLVYILLNNLFFFLVRSCYIHIPTSVHLGFRTSTHASHHHNCVTYLKVLNVWMPRRGGVVACACPFSQRRIAAA